MTDEELTKLEALVDETDWLLQGCSSKFRVEIPALIAEVRRWQREAALRSAQLLMVGSELAGDSKLHCLQDRCDPRWTPMLQEAWAAREKIREDVGIARAEKAEAACAELRAALEECVGAMARSDDCDTRGGCYTQGLIANARRVLAL